MSGGDAVEQGGRRQGAVAPAIVVPAVAAEPLARRQGTGPPGDRREHVLQARQIGVDARAAEGVALEVQVRVDETGQHAAPGQIDAVRAAGGPEDLLVGAECLDPTVAGPQRRRPRRGRVHRVHDAACEDEPRRAESSSYRVPSESVEGEVWRRADG